MSQAKDNVEKKHALTYGDMEVEHSEIICIWLMIFLLLFSIHIVDIFFPFSTCIPY